MACNRVDCVRSSSRTCEACTSIAMVWRLLKGAKQAAGGCLQVFFAATGVSDGDLLKGVRYFSGGASTNSIVMRSSSGTVRYIETHHRWRAPTALIQG